VTVRDESYKAALRRKHEGVVYGKGGGKSAGEIDRDNQRFYESLPLTVSCALCPSWGPYTKPARVALRLAERHRERRHGGGA
jgi:hypothetical protein